MKDNTPAFPVQSIYVSDREENSRGMTLRDYFAAKAVQGLIANGSDNPFIASKAAYVVADAMMKARTE